VTDHPPSDAKKQVDVAIAIVFDPPRRQVLICQRKSDTVLAGYWELPGGKCDPGETPDVCAVREVREEVGIAVRAIRGLEVIEHEYAYAHVRLFPFVCEHLDGRVQMIAVADAKWVPPADVLTYRFPEANAALMQRVAQGWSSLIEQT